MCCTKFGFKKSRRGDGRDQPCASLEELMKETRQGLGLALFIASMVSIFVELGMAANPFFPRFSPMWVFLSFTVLGISTLMVWE
jgi:hypothetical protein